MLPRTSLVPAWGLGIPPFHCIHPLFPSRKPRSKEEKNQELPLSKQLEQQQRHMQQPSRSPRPFSRRRGRYRPVMHLLKIIARHSSTSHRTTDGTYLAVPPHAPWSRPRVVYSSGTPSSTYLPACVPSSCRTPSTSPPSPSRTRSHCHSLVRNVRSTYLMDRRARGQGGKGRARRADVVGLGCG